MSVFVRLLGLLLVGVGLWRVYPPLAWIYAGLLLLALGHALDAVRSDPTAGETPPLKPLKVER